MTDERSGTCAPGAVHNTVHLATLFVAFLRVGLTAFGGPAMIPHIRKLAVERNAWISEKDFRLGLSVCQVIPGATVMQLAAFVGLRVHGLAGALAAFIGFGLPAFVLITLLSVLYFTFQDLGWMVSAFAGLKLIVLAIILSASIDFIKKYVDSATDILIAAGAACAILLHMHPALIILAAMLAGMMVYKTKDVASGQIAAREPAGSGSHALRLGLGLAFLILVLWIVSPELAGIALRMMRIDLFAFGGGFAALPMMLHEVVNITGWLSEKTFLDGIALGQITPGPIVITSAFVGYAVKGVAGALAATIGIFSPSILIMVWAVPHCDRLLGSNLFQKAMSASLATLSGLMAATLVSLAMPIDWSFPGALLAAAAFVALRRHVDVLWVVLVGSAISLAIV